MRRVQCRSSKSGVLKGLRQSLSMESMSGEQKSREGSSSGVRPAAAGSSGQLWTQDITFMMV